jgi:hypothetical protein
LTRPRRSRRLAVGRACAASYLASGRTNVLCEGPDRNAEPSELHVVRRISDEHRRFDDLGPELFEAGPGLRATDQIVRIAAATEFAHDPHRVDELVAAPLGKDGQLALLQVDGPLGHPLIERCLREEDAVFHARSRPKGYTTAGRMRVLEAVARIVELGGAAEHAASIVQLRAHFEERAGAFAPEDPWFEERSRAFWCDAVTRGKFGRAVEAELTPEQRAWLGPLERAHRGLFRAGDLRTLEPPRRRGPGTSPALRGGGPRHEAVLVDEWSGAELVITLVDDESRAELAAAAGQLFDARVAADQGASGLLVALLPGAVFHPRNATAAIGPVLAAARHRELSTDDVLDALLRMERTLRSLSRVKAAYAYRPDGLTPRATSVLGRRAARTPT